MRAGEQREERVREVECDILDEVPLNAEDAVHYDRDGEPIGLREYLRLRRDREYRIIAHDRAGNGEVTTVWHGTDQGWGGRPLIYGTLARGSSVEDVEHFAATLEDAQRNHEELKRKLESEV